MTFSKGSKKNEIREIVDLIIEHYDTLLSAWIATLGK